MSNQPESKDASDRIIDPDSIEMKLWRIKVDLYREKEKKIKRQREKSEYIADMKYNLLEMLRRIDHPE